MNEIERYYRDPKIGLTSAYKLYQKLKMVNPKITLKAVRDYLNALPEYQVLKENKKPRQFNTIVAERPLHSVQMDLLIYDRYEIHKYKYILVMIDVYTRFAAARPLTSRENNIILENINDIIEQDFENGKIENINCDNEFNKKVFNDWATRNNITFHFSDPEEINKNAIVERFNRTLAMKLQRYRIATNKYEWYKVLPEIITNYNNTYHRTIKTTPQSIFSNLDVNHQVINVVPSTLNIGDMVRTKEYKKVFDKGDKIKYSTDTYIIQAINGNKYTLMNTNTDNILKKKYKAYELQKINRIIKKEIEAPAIMDQQQIKRSQKQMLKREGIDQNNITISRTRRRYATRSH